MSKEIGQVGQVRLGNFSVFAVVLREKRDSRAYDRHIMHLHVRPGVRETNIASPRRRLTLVEENVRLWEQFGVMPRTQQR